MFHKTINNQMSKYIVNNHAEIKTALYKATCHDTSSFLFQDVNNLMCFEINRIRSSILQTIQHPINEPSKIIDSVSVLQLLAIQF